MNKKGQALIEFVLILPVILLVLVSLIDIGNIFMEKYKLVDNLGTIVEMYQNENEKEAKAYAAKENIIVDQSITGNLTTITTTKNIKVSTPILKNILGKNYNIKASQTIYFGGDSSE